MPGAKHRWLAHAQAHHPILFNGEHVLAESTTSLRPRAKITVHLSSFFPWSFLGMSPHLRLSSLPL